MLEKRKKDKWLGDFGGMRIEFSVKDLYLDIVEEEQEKNVEKPKVQSKKKKKKNKRQSNNQLPAEPIKMVEFRHDSNTTDVRGMRKLMMR